MVSSDPFHQLGSFHLTTPLSSILRARRWIRSITGSVRIRNKTATRIEFSWSVGLIKSPKNGSTTSASFLLKRPMRKMTADVKRSTGKEGPKTGVKRVKTAETTRKRLVMYVLLTGLLRIRE